jgi:hypothetical protein
MANFERVDALPCGPEAKLLDGVMFSTFRLPIHVSALSACSAVSYPDD